MENNTDIIVLTSVIIVLFIVFIIATVREFNTMSTTKYVDRVEGEPSTNLLRLIGRLFADDKIDDNKKIIFMNAVNPIIEELLQDEDVKKE
jgi:hypothetical protein